MSDLPLCQSLAPVSPTQRRNAAISVCQLADYDPDRTVQYLLALGLITPGADGYVPAIGIGEVAWHQAARR